VVTFMLIRHQYLLKEPTFYNLLPALFLTCTSSANPQDTTNTGALNFEKPESLQD
jgi:hypothetical protein